MTDQHQYAVVPEDHRSIGGRVNWPMQDDVSRYKEMRVEQDEQVEGLTRDRPI